MYETNRKELVELAKNLLEREEDAEFYAISQVTNILNDQFLLFIHKNICNWMI